MSHLNQANFVETAFYNVEHSKKNVWGFAAEHEYKHVYGSWSTTQMGLTHPYRAHYTQHM